MTNLHKQLWMEARGMVILKIIYELGYSVNIKDLCEITGGHHNTVTKYCAILATMGLITRVSYRTGWIPTAKGLAFMHRTPGMLTRAELSTGAADNLPGQNSLGENQQCTEVNGHNPAGYPMQNPHIAAETPGTFAEKPRYLAENPFNFAEKPRYLADNQVNIAEKPRYLVDNQGHFAEIAGYLLNNMLNLAENQLYSAKNQLNSAKNQLNSADSDLLINTTTTTTSIDSSVVEVLSAESAFFSQNYAFFQEIGITLNRQTKFIATHIAPQVIQAEWKKLEEKGKPWPGLLIRILGSLPKSKTKEQRDRDARLRYAQWGQKKR